MTKSQSAQTPQQQPMPSPELKRLDILVGTWSTQGKVEANPTDPGVKIIGTDTYEWQHGGFFLIHRVDVRIGDEKIEAIEIIGGYDASSQTYPMRSFDSQGNFVTMEASVNDDGLWTFTGESARATLAVSDDGNTLTAKWERLTDGSKWLPWMDLKLTMAR